MARAPSVNGHGSPPNGLISHSCAFGSSPFAAFALGRGRVVRKARSRPSGDQRGLVQLSLPRVSRLTAIATNNIRTMRQDSSADALVQDQRTCCLLVATSVLACGLQQPT